MDIYLVVLIVWLLSGLLGTLFAIAYFRPKGIFGKELIGLFIAPFGGPITCVLFLLDYIKAYRSLK